MCLQVSTVRLKKVVNRKCIHTIVTPRLQLCACRSEEDIHSPLPPHKQRCFIVFKLALMLLFTLCSYCRSRYTRVSKTVIGSFLRITQSCSKCGYRFIWDSQPYIGSTPAGNILMSAAILYSGVIPAKALRVF